MPFIRGRYHMNPIVRQALEAAREAEAARLAGNDQGSQGDSEGADDGYGQTEEAQTERGPIHRVEIEAAEMVPAHAGRAQRGFVAHVHREAGDVPTGSDALQRAQHAAPLQVRKPGQYPSSAYAPRPETHVFADHRDLVSFLRDQFAKD